MAARGLGKGLDALIPSAAAQPKTKEKKEKETSVEKPDSFVDINKVEPNREQPRKHFDEDALLEGLNSGKVKAAGLDVWLSEKDPNWELAGHPAVSCTPHIGAGTKECQGRIGLELVDVIKSTFEA